MIPANAMFLASTLSVWMTKSRLRLSIVQLAARPDRSMECRRTAVDQGGALGAGNSARQHGCDAMNFRCALSRSRLGSAMASWLLSIRPGIGLSPLGTSGGANDVCFWSAEFFRSWSSTAHFGGGRSSAMALESVLYHQDEIQSAV